MRWTIPLVTSLLLTAFATGTVVAYECNTVEDATVCTGDEGADAYVAGVGGAYYYESEYTFWGYTYRSQGAGAWTDPNSDVGNNNAGVSTFCMDAGDDGTCEYESQDASASTAWNGPLGYNSLYLSHWCSANADGNCETNGANGNAYVNEQGYTSVFYNAHSGEVCTYSQPLEQDYECTPVLP